MIKAASSRKFVRLAFQDSQVVVAPEDQDAFLISAERATEACVDAIAHDERVSSFRSRIILPLHQWCVARADLVAACYVPLANRFLHVFIVTKSERFDFDLAEEISALELGLAKSGWRISIMELPKAEEHSQAAFFNLDGALEIYAQR